MKIEKLTDNKIRVIVNIEELDIDISKVDCVSPKALETQDFFATILKKAQKDFDFDTDGCKLLIEVFSSLEDVFVFTITKLTEENKLFKKKLIAKRRTVPDLKEKVICKFDDFDCFANCCKAIENIHKLNNNKLSKMLTLYFWKDYYYLVWKNKNISNNDFSLFYSCLLEFGKIVSYSEHFENKLLEHGDVVLKKNVLEIGLKLC